MADESGYTAATEEGSFPATEYQVLHDLIEGALPDALHDSEMSPAEVLGMVLWDHGYRLPAAPVGPTEEQLGKLIWDTSRVDEGSISVTGAKIVARSILARFVLGHAADQVRAEALREAHGIISRRTGTYEAGIDLMERVAELEAGAGQ